MCYSVLGTLRVIEFPEFSNYYVVFIVARINESELDKYAMDEGSLY
jgi:hypothetical protein